MPKATGRDLSPYLAIFCVWVPALKTFADAKPRSRPSKLFEINILRVAAENDGDGKHRKPNVFNILPVKY